MSNELTTRAGQLTTPASEQVSLMDMRMDAKRFPRIGSVSRESAIHEMSRIVSQAFLYKGQAADATNIQFISCALVDELQSDLDRVGTKFISFAEISRIIKRAILTEEMFGISVASLYKVIIEYIKGEGHRLQKEIDRKREEEQRKKLKDSIIAPMLQAYAGAMVKRSKV